MPWCGGTAAATAAGVHTLRAVAERRQQCFFILEAKLFGQNLELLFRSQNPIIHAMPMKIAL